MNIFEFRQDVIRQYEAFVYIRDRDVRAYVDAQMSSGVFWFDPLAQLNPNFMPGGSVGDLLRAGTLPPQCADLFAAGEPRAPLNLHAHQRDAARLACEGRSYVVTTGTGSGKSLTYILPSVDYMGTFPIVRRKDLAAHGSYRTKEAILSVYDGLLGLERLSEYCSRVPGGDVAGGWGP